MSVLGGLAVSLVSGFVAARWTLKGALHQRFWERKEAAYQEILEGVHQIKLYYDVRSGESLQHDLRGEGGKGEEVRLEGIRKLERCCDVHRWLVDRETMQLVGIVVWREGRDPKRLVESEDYGERAGAIGKVLREIHAGATRTLDPGRAWREAKARAWRLLTPMGWLDMAIEWHDRADSVKG